MGENPKTVFVVGGLGIDSIDQIEPLNKLDLETRLGITLSKNYALVTYHADTIHPEHSLDQLEILLRSIKKFPEIQFIATGANADYYGEQINLRLQEASAQEKNLFFSQSIGQLNYLSLMSGAKFVLGNSSSGLLEAPSLGIAAINIGTRQHGRPKALSVIDVEFSEDAITQGVIEVLSKNFIDSIKVIQNPYGEAGASDKIFEALQSLDLATLLPKQFLDAP
jgi:UDP-hydrolysing UDP-N-acetyl-D-glucosamine 2-epimerase